MSGQILFSIIAVLALGSIAGAAPSGRERARDLEKPKAEGGTAVQARDLNTKVASERTASQIAEDALQDTTCDGKCRVAAMAIESMVRNPAGLDLGASEHSVAQTIARDVRAGQDSGLKLPQAIQRALLNREIDQEEFNEACGPR